MSWGADGGFVTGYSPPPPAATLDTALNCALNTPILICLCRIAAEPVQVVQLMERAKIDGLEGLVLVSVSGRICSSARRWPTDLALPERA